MNKVTMPNQDRDCITCSKHLPAQKIPHECHVCLNATENLKGYYLPLWEPIMSKSYDAAWRTEEAKQIVDLIEKTESSDGSSANYYVLPKGATQLQDLIAFKNMNGQIAEIFRACYRMGQESHSPNLRDAKKIQFYAQAEVNRLEKYGCK